MEEPSFGLPGDVESLVVYAPGVARSTDGKKVGGGGRSSSPSNAGVDESEAVLPRLPLGRFDTTIAPMEADRTALGADIEPSSSAAGATQPIATAPAPIHVSVDTARQLLAGDGLLPASVGSKRSRAGHASKPSPSEMYLIRRACVLAALGGNRDSDSDYTTMKNSSLSVRFARSELEAICARGDGSVVVSRLRQVLSLQGGKPRELNPDSLPANASPSKRPRTAVESGSAPAEVLRSLDALSVFVYGDQYGLMQPDTTPDLATAGEVDVSKSRPSRRSSKGGRKASPSPAAAAEAARDAGLKAIAQGVESLAREGRIYEMLVEEIE